MKIQARLRPFSHLPGASCVIPGTCVEIEAYPTLLKIGSIQIRLDVTGPVADFTLEQDLEKNCVWVYGKAKEGFYRLRLEANDAGFDLYLERGNIAINGRLLKAKDHLHFPAEISFVLKTDCEVLSLGNHKAQDWDLVQKRCDPREFLPPLFTLGQKIPLLPPQPLKGTARLLEFPPERNQIIPALIAFFKAAFSQILVPRLIDDQHQGLVPDEPASGNRHFLLQEGAKRIRALFFQQEERRLHLLPLLPPDLHAGRLLNLKAPGIGTLDFEWTKGTLRQVLLRATTSGEVLFDLKGLKTFRVNKKNRHPATEPLLLQAGKTYFLDRFQG